MSRTQARSVLDWISRSDGAEVNELALAAAHGIGLNRDSIPGLWLGSGARNLGLTGEANLDQARRLFIHGLDPQGQAVASPNVERSFYSAVFDVDKSVSLLLAHSDPRVREALNQAMEIAMESAFHVLEQQARIRRGKGGITSEQPVGLTGLRFSHQASSAGDPHAHMHLMLLATAQGADGKWVTLDGRQIFAQGMRMATQEFQIALYRELNRQLDLSQLNPGWMHVGSTLVFRLNELAPSCQALSNASRSMAKAWQAISDRKIIVGLSHRQHQIAWARHRRDKRELIEHLEHELDEVLHEEGERASKLRQLWRDKMGDGQRILGKIGVRTDPEANPPVPSKFSHNAIFGEIAKLHTFNLADLTNLYRFFDLSVDAGAWPVITAKSVLSSPDLFVLTDELKEILRQWIEAMETNQASVATEIMVGIYGTSAKHKITTRVALNEEEAIARGATELSMIKRTSLLPVVPESATFEQTKAIQAIARGRGLTVISGVAGSGKTFILRPITEAATRQGLAVLALARNANLASALGAELGVKSASLASFALAVENDRVDRRAPLLIIVDEAGLIDRRDWEVLANFAKHHPTQIVAVGDRRQAQPIDGRATFATIMERAITTGACQTLETTYRNKAWVKEATALRNADADTVLACATTAHRVVGCGEDELLDNVWTQYVACTQRGEDVVVLARDNENAATMASLIQERLGIVGTHEISKEELVGVGDEVRTRCNVRQLGITNGDRFRVTNIGESGISLRRLDNNRIVNVSWEYASQYVELAYASTIDSVQGQTRDRVIVLVDSAMGNTSLYSGTTRGRQAPIYLVRTETNEPNEVLAGAIGNDDVAMTLKEIYVTNQASQSNEVANLTQTTTATARAEQSANTKDVQADEHLTKSKQDRSRVDDTNAQELDHTQGAVPTAQGAVPTAQGAVPTAQGAVPTAQGAVPNAQGAVPTAQGAVPNAQGAGAPVDVGHASTGRVNAGRVNAGSVNAGRAGADHTVTDRTGTQGAALDHETIGHTIGQHTTSDQAHVDDRGVDDRGVGGTAENSNTPLSSREPMLAGPVPTVDTPRESEPVTPAGTGPQPRDPQLGGQGLTSQPKSQATSVSNPSPTRSGAAHANERNEMHAPGKETKNDEIEGNATKGDNQSAIGQTPRTPHDTIANTPTMRGAVQVTTNPAEPMSGSRSTINPSGSNATGDRDVARLRSETPAITNTGEVNESGPGTQQEQIGYEPKELEENDERAQQQSPLVMTGQEQPDDGHDVSSFANWLPVEDFSELNRSAYITDISHYGKLQSQSQSHRSLTLDKRAQRDDLRSSEIASEVVATGHEATNPARQICDTPRINQEVARGTKSRILIRDIRNVRGSQQADSSSAGQVEGDAFGEDLGRGLTETSTRDFERGGVEERRDAESTVPRPVPNQVSGPDKDVDQDNDREEVADEQLDVSTDDEQQESPSQRRGIGFGFGF